MFHCRNGNDLSEIAQFGVTIDNLEQLPLVNKIDLIQEQDHRRTHVLEQLENKLVALAERLRSINDQKSHIALLERSAHFTHHPAAQRRIGLMHARSIDQHNLSRRSSLPALHVDVSLDAMPRSLRLVRNDRDLFANQRIQQRRLSRIGTTDNGDEAGSKGHKTLGNRPGV